MDVITNRLFSPESSKTLASKQIQYSGPENGTEELRGKRCAGLSDKRTAGRAMETVPGPAARAGKGKNRFYWGKKSPCLWLVCVKVI